MPLPTPILRSLSFMAWAKRRALWQFGPYRRVAGRALVAIDDVNRRIASLVLTGEPFLVARFGATETRAITDWREMEKGCRRQFSAPVFEYMHRNAGFFPEGDADALAAFCRLMLDVAPDIDVLGCFADGSEDAIVRDFVRPDVMLTYVTKLLPCLSAVPWSAALQGKRVVVVHPFSASIVRQYLKRETLFTNPATLPAFDLRTVRAVQTIAGEPTAYASWFDALDGMLAEVCAQDFDVAIVGCGAYGLPLAARIKRIGKGAIHLGGATQMLFGITGERWAANPQYQPLINAHWVRPAPDETPQRYKTVEGGCYW